MADPIFIYDVSEHQGPPDEPKLFDHAQAYKEGYRAVIVRTGQGTYEDKHVRDHIEAIRKTPLLLGAYHRIGDTSSPATNAAKVDKMLAGDKSIVVWLDTEDHPVDATKTWHVAQELQQLGYTVRGSYFPKWYWESIGKPPLRVGPLWASEYVPGTGYGSTLYQKVPGDWWSGYGGQKVTLLQFTEKAKVAGQIIDVSAFRGTMAELEKLFTADAPQPDPRPVPAPVQPAAVTTLKGTPLDLSDLPTGKGPRFKFRDRLTNTAGVYPGCVCDCIPKHIALVEALAKEAGLPVPLQFWEGSFITTKNSGTTHAGGGAYDIKIDRVPGRKDLTDAQVTLLTKIERQAGGMAYYRGPGTKYGNFDTRHIHVEVIGCTHASAAARAQWADYKNGRDALAINGPDYGPKVAYIEAAAAFKKLTRTTSGDWLDMATQKEVEQAVHDALGSYLGDRFPSPSLTPDNVKKNPTWSFASTIGWLTKLVALIRRDMPTKKQIEQLIAAVKENKPS